MTIKPNDARAMALINRVLGQSHTEASSICANVAVLGLGILGSAMARDAGRAGMNVTAWDGYPNRASRLAANKLHLTPTPVNAVPHADWK
jgi:phosphoglycerate dehydrogenase-like enzyme